MATSLKPNGSPASAGNGNPAPAPAPAANTITGTFSGLKPPAVNGIALLGAAGLQSFTAAAPQGMPSTPLPLTGGAAAQHLVGDLTNGVAVATADNIYYLTGVGINGAMWNPLALPANVSNIVSICGDLVNGLVITDGTELYAWTFSGSSANEWLPLAQLPASTAVRDMAGDPTNGVLLALSGGSGPSSLYFGGAGCSCSWVPVTAAGTSLPSARVAVQTVSGNYTNGFVLFGENQLFALSGLKYTAGSSSAAGSCTATYAKIPSTPPFQITDLTGDPTNGITARSGDVLVANAVSPYAAWTLVNAAPPAAAGGQGTGSGSGSGAGPAPASAPAPGSAAGPGSGAAPGQGAPATGSNAGTEVPAPTVYVAIDTIPQAA